MSKSDWSVVGWLSKTKKEDSKSLVLFVNEEFVGFVSIKSLTKLMNDEIKSVSVQVKKNGDQSGND